MIWKCVNCKFFRESSDRDGCGYCTHLREETYIDEVCASFNNEVVEKEVFSV